MVGDTLFSPCPHLRLLDAMEQLKIQYRKQDKKLDSVVIDWLYEFIKPNWNCIDIGANIGIISLHISKCTNGKILAIEPELANYEILQKHIASNKASNIQCLRLAISSSVGVSYMYVNRKNFGDNRCWVNKNTTEGREVFKKTEKVKTTTLDVLASDSDTKFDFVKMDIQGMEWKALDGMGKFMDINPQARFLIEFWPWGIKGCGGSVEKFCNSIDRYFTNISVVNGSKIKSSCGIKITTKFLKRIPCKRKLHCDLLLEPR